MSLSVTEKHRVHGSGDVEVDPTKSEKTNARSATPPIEIDPEQLHAAPTQIAVRHELAGAIADVKASIAALRAGGTSGCDGLSLEQKERLTRDAEATLRTLEKLERDVNEPEANAFGKDLGKIKEALHEMHAGVELMIEVTAHVPVPAAKAAAIAVGTALVAKGMIDLVEGGKHAWADRHEATNAAPVWQAIVEDARTLKASADRLARDLVDATIRRPNVCIRS